MLRNAILIVGPESLTMEASKQMRVSRPYKISESSKVTWAVPLHPWYQFLLPPSYVSLTVSACGFAEALLGIAPSIFHITMTGGTKEPRDFCLCVDLTNDVSLMESPASDLKIGPVFLMLGHQGSLLSMCPTPWDPKNEQVWTPWVLTTSPNQAGFIRIRLSESGKNPGRMTMPSGQGAHL